MSGAARALARRAFSDARVRTNAFAWPFGAVRYIQPVAYRHTYPAVADRLQFARSFGGNAAIRLFYGAPHDLLSVGGYAAWRAGGILAIFAAVFGGLAAVRALRAEEDAGRTELVLAGVLTRRRAFLASIAAIGTGGTLLWLAALLGLVAGQLPAGQSAFLALAIVSPVPVFAGLGAVASQLAPTRRMAVELVGGAIAVTFLLRVVADTAGGVGWLRWVTPLGWAEELRPFAGARPSVLLAPAAAAAILLGAAMRLALARDVGSGLLAARDTGPCREKLLASPIRFALRTERSTILVWLVSVGAFAFIVGVISKSISSAGISASLQRELARLGSGSLLTPRGYLGLSFIFFVFAVSLFGVSQIAGARHEEASERLETLLALPIGRWQWLGGRLTVAAVAVALVSLTSGVAAWAGATAAGAAIALPRMLEAGVDCLPTALLFLGLAALLYGFVPRAGAGFAYGLVTVAFLWQLFGALLGAPGWLVDVSPFKHVGTAPQGSFPVGASLVMVAIGPAAGAGAVAAFRRRDLLAA